MEKVILTDQEKRQIEEGGEVLTFEGLYYLFYHNALRRYRIAPMWDTYHDLAKALLNPFHTEWSQTAVAQQNKKFFRPDIETAAYLALLDLYNRVNGGLPPVTMRQDALEAQPTPILRMENAKLLSQPLDPVLGVSFEGCVPNGPVDGPPTNPIRKKRGRPRSL